MISHRHPSPSISPGSCIITKPPECGSRSVGNNIETMRSLGDTAKLLVNDNKTVTEESDRKRGRSAGTLSKTSPFLRQESDQIERR